MSQAASGCDRCAEGRAQRFATPFSMAFQPIFDTRNQCVFAHEALLRTLGGEGAEDVMKKVSDETRYYFDQECRVTAIILAARLGIRDRISINFMPNAVYNPENCLRRTIWAADKYNIALDQIIFELTEHEAVVDFDHLRNIIETYRKVGLRTALDDFGAGYSGLRLLAELEPDYIKLDRALISFIDREPRRRAIVEGTVEIAGKLGITVIAEGIERVEEARVLADLGIDLMQGFLFAEPRFEAVADRSDVAWSALSEQPNDHQKD